MKQLFGKTEQFKLKGEYVLQYLYCMLSDCILYPLLYSQFKNLFQICYLHLVQPFYHAAPRSIPSSSSRGPVVYCCNLYLCIFTE